MREFRSALQRVYDIFKIPSLYSEREKCLEALFKGKEVYRGYFMVGECGRFFFTSCERRERTSERSERVSSATPRNE